MTDQDEAPSEIPVEITKKRSLWRWLGLLGKIIFVIGAIVLIGMVVMANMGGSSENLKSSMEDFIKESTKYTAKIEKFNGVKFFPEISFDAENINMSPKGSVDTLIHVEKVKIVLSFWDVMVANGKLKIFDIRGVKSLPGGLLEVPMDIETMQIVDADPPYFEAKGRINEKPASFTFNMEKSGAGQGRKFIFGPERKLDLNLGDIKATARMISPGEGKISFEDIEVTLAGKKILSGRIEITRAPEMVTIGGRIEIEQHHTNIVPAIEIDLSSHNQSPIIGGSINSAVFHTQDFAAGSDYDRLISALTSMFKKLPELPANEITLEIEAIHRGGKKPTGSHSGPVPLKGWRIDTDAIKAKP